MRACIQLYVVLSVKYFEFYSDFSSKNKRFNAVFVCAHVYNCTCVRKSDRSKTLLLPLI